MRNTQVRCSQGTYSAIKTEIPGSESYIICDYVCAFNVNTNILTFNVKTCSYNNV